MFSSTQTAKSVLLPEENPVLPLHQVGQAEEGEQLRDLEQLTRWAMLSAVRELVPAHRTASCSRFITSPLVTGLDAVQVMHSPAQGDHQARARFGNLTRCANVWSCPVCSPRIAQGRSEDLRDVLRRHTGEGGRVLFITLTHRHERGDDLAAQIAQQGRALEHMQRQRSWRAWSRRAGVVGTVRALEFTHSEANGWHPHFHLLILVAGTRKTAKRHAEVMTALDDQRRQGDEPASRRVPVNVPRVRELPGLCAELVAAWLVSADVCGLEAEPQAQRAEVAPSDLRTLEKLADYLSGPGGAADVDAFAGDAHHHAAARVAVEGAGQGRAGDLAGAAYELAGASLKLARAEQGATPFELLREFTEQGNQRAGKLFAEYVTATRGRRALSYSNGLRALYALEDEQPAEAAAQEDARPEEAELCQIDLDDWRVLLRGHRANRGRLLKVARRGDPDTVRDTVRVMVDAVRRGETRTPPPEPTPPAPTSPTPVPARPNSLPTLFDVPTLPVLSVVSVSSTLEPGAAHGGHAPGAVLGAGPPGDGSGSVGPPGG